MFTCEYYKIIKNTYFEKHLRMAASVFRTLPKRTFHIWCFPRLLIAAYVADLIPNFKSNPNDKSMFENIFQTNNFSSYLSFLRCYLWQNVLQLVVDERESLNTPYDSNKFQYILNLTVVLYQKWRTAVLTSFQYLKSKTSC